MKRRCKRLIAVLLSATMMVGVLQIDAACIENENERQYLVHIMDKCEEQIFIDKVIQNDDFTKGLDNHGMYLCNMTSKEVEEFEDENVCIEPNIEFSLNEVVIDTQDVISDWNIKMINADDVENVEGDEKI